MQYNALDPFEFDADPNLVSALEMDRDLGHEQFFQINWFVKQIRMFKLFFIFSFAHFWAKTFGNKEIFDKTSFYNRLDLVFESKHFFCIIWSIFCPLIRIRGSAYADPDWKKTKMLRIQRIRILSTAFKCKLKREKCVHLIIQISWTTNRTTGNRK